MAHSEGRRRSFMRAKKSAQRWENRTDEELQEIYWNLKSVGQYKKQFVFFCDFLIRHNKTNIIK